MQAAASSSVDVLELEEDYALPPWSRTLCGYHERFVAPFVLPLGDGRSLRLKQAPRVSAAHSAEASSSADGGATTGATVWDAGIVLAAHLLQSAADRRGVCLDLGSGTGVVGLAAAASGGFSRVLLSDLPTVVPLCAENLRANAAALATPAAPVALRWDDAADLRRVAAMGPFELIVGGDLLYREQVATLTRSPAPAPLPAAQPRSSSRAAQVVAPLLAAVRALAGPATTVLLAASLQHSPSTIRAFAAAAADAGFEVRPLGEEAQHAEWRSAEVRLLQLRCNA